MKTLKVRKIFKWIFIVIFNLVIISLLFLWCAWTFNWETPRDKQLKKGGEEIIMSVEEFRQSHGRLPANLREMNLLETESGPLYYEKENDAKYIIFYNTGFDETHTYYSNTKEWEVLYQ